MKKSPEYLQSRISHMPAGTTSRVTDSNLEDCVNVNWASCRPKTEIAIEWQAEKDRVGRAERG